MKKIGLTQRRRTEKAIIDALLKISEIVQKTETSRQRQKSKKTIGDGDCSEVHNDGDEEQQQQQQQVPVPPSMRTIDSYVSGFNQQSIEKSSYSNQTSIHKPKQHILSPSWNSQETDQRYDRSLGQEYADNNEYKNQEHSNKRCYYDSSSTSLSSNDNHYRKKSFKHHSSHKSVQSNKNLQPVFQESEKTENQPTIATVHSHTTSYQVNSAATTILDDQSSSLVMMPMTSALTKSLPIANEQQSSINSTPVHTEQQQHFSSSSNILTDFDVFIDQQLQATLEKHLKNNLLSSTNRENIPTPRKTRVVTLTKSETGKLMNELKFTKQACNLEHYDKQYKLLKFIYKIRVESENCIYLFQRELAMLAAKQGNYSLSYSIYTNLLHDTQDDFKLKSEILASRATTLLLEQKCFESIDDCTQAIAFNQWNKLAYVVRAACWMIKQEYSKAVEDYSKLFHFFDQSQHVLDLLNLAYEKLKSFNNDIDDEQSIKIEQEKEDIQSIKNIKNDNNTTQPMTSLIDTCVNPTQSLSLVSPTASFMQPAIYLCYPYQAYPTWYSTNNNEQRTTTNGEEIQQPTYIITNASFTSHPSLIIDQSPMSSEKPFQNLYQTKHKSCQSIHSNNNALLSTIEHESSSINKNLQSNLIWIKNPYRSF
ncbi:unnamed protein product [Rotaria sp. Silwood2]|nr:unnamed protein product [Rotaria sp. Silwood2]CAF2587584.1 unnamed protein product [Rotaria sp. Silwood2]CAF2999478.1 unnamed protein product [Rotaria sp. Silwood2]CAF4238136.1 unnamed protein product [Rotaria sp. Silwood2]CAF4427708.1 unnamed protein product [Rotaria sp. Silwood2]